MALRMSLEEERHRQEAVRIYSNTLRTYSIHYRLYARKKQSKKNEADGQKLAKVILKK